MPLNSKADEKAAAFSFAVPLVLFALCPCSFPLFLSAVALKAPFSSARPPTTPSSRCGTARHCLRRYQPLLGSCAECVSRGGSAARRPSGNRAALHTRSAAELCDLEAGVFWVSSGQPRESEWIGGEGREREPVKGRRQDRERSGEQRSRSSLPAQAAVRTGQESSARSSSPRAGSGAHRAVETKGAAARRKKKDSKQALACSGVGCKSAFSTFEFVWFV